MPATTAQPPTTTDPWSAVVDWTAPELAARAAALDESGVFAAENYDLLAERRLFSAGVPEEFGGGGASHRELCEILRGIGRHCGSTALALSMHTHLVAAAVWRHRHGKPAEKLLRKVAESEVVLVSTGASDWLGSNGSLTPVEGGYRYTGTKICCSGSPAGQVLITSGALEGGPDGPEVLHFPVPMRADGVEIVEDWDVLGMRATGSHTVTLADVFVPAEAIVLRRPRAGWHPSWSVVLTVAMPLIMSAYLGVTEAACAISRDVAVRKGANQPLAQLGEMENRLAAAQIAVASMVELADDYDFEPSLERANAVLVRKSLAVEAMLQAVDAAMEAGGGAMFARKLGFERCFRDVQGCRFHPLPASKQREFTAKVVLGEDPVL